MGHSASSPLHVVLVAQACSGAMFFWESSRILLAQNGTPMLRPLLCQSGFPQDVFFWYQRLHTDASVATGVDEPGSIGSGVEGGKGSVEEPVGVYVSVYANDSQMYLIREAMRGCSKS